MFLFDADSHYYEPSDCCTRYIEPEFRERTVWIDHAAKGEPVYVGREQLRYLGINPTAAVPPAEPSRHSSPKGRTTWTDTRSA